MSDCCLTQNAHCFSSISWRGQITFGRDDDDDDDDVRFVLDQTRLIGSL